MRWPLHTLQIDGDTRRDAETRSWPVLQKGFRPFFLLGAVVAVTMLGAWLMVLFGTFAPATRFSVSAWHGHEMLFGFAVAIIAGFLLTAVGNWTQRDTAVGPKLLLLCLLFVAGRVAVTYGALLPPWLPVAVDVGFLPVLAVVLGRPIVATHNTKNLVVVVVVLALAVTNLMMHLGALGLAADWEHRGLLVAVDLVILIASIIACRVFPMFTRNATRQESIRGVPRLDVAALVAIATLTVLDAARVQHAVVGVLFVGAACLLVARARHWGTRFTLRTPLLWVLHAGYAWMCLGLCLRGVAMLTTRVPASLALHALTVGAIGSLTLGMISRVSLGHTGRLLEAPPSATVAFVLMTLAAVSRVIVPLAAPEWTRPSLLVAGLLFASAFGVLLVGYTRMLLSARVDEKAG